MSNMGYCRFQNTLSDLRDCQEHLDDEVEGDEAVARKAFIATCCEIAADFGNDDE